jgi:hypothetical protein
MQGNYYSFDCLSKTKLPITVKFLCLKSDHECFLDNSAFIDISNIRNMYERHAIFNELSTCHIINIPLDKLSFYSLSQDGWHEDQN